VSGSLEGRTIELIAFDLDNTLYDEGQYYRAAFRLIAPRLAVHAGCDAASVERRLSAVIDEKGRHYHHLFNDVLGELGLPLQPHLDDVLRVFASVTGRLRPCPGSRRLLADLGRRYRLGMITSGRREVQQNKIALLGIGRHFEHIVFSSTLPENKPGRMPFQHLLDLTGIAPDRAVYVGDNPLADFTGANALGMLTIRVRNREFDRLDVAAECDGCVRIEGIHELRRLFL
jgi:HAD superfamily hydrolase (TIGR01509 family)